MYLKVVTPEVKFEVAPGDAVQAGIVITNSEVGCGTLAVQPLSQDVKDYDRATEFEALGGKWIDLAPSEWNAVVVAA